MKITRKKALQLTKWLWGWLAKTGSYSKDAWPGWEKYGEMRNDCPLCEYSFRQVTGGVEPGQSGRWCDACPLGLGRMGCYKTVYHAWENTKEGDVGRRKFLAKMVLNRLGEIES